MKKNVFVGLLFASTFITHQSQAQTQKRIQVSDAFVQVGFIMEPVAMGHLSEFKLFAPQSELIAQDMTGFSASNSTSMNVNTYFTTAMGIQFLNKEKQAYKSNPLLRIGISYNSGTHLFNGYGRYTHAIVDTLISQQTGQMYFIDSTSVKNYGMNLSSQQLRFDASLIFRTNPEARWSVYGGIGFNFGAAFKSNVQISYSSYSYSNNQAGYSNNLTSSSDEHKYEQFNNTTRILGGSVYLPMGVDFRIGKNKPFWKQTHLFYELKPNLNITAIQNSSTILNGVFQHGMGLHVTF